MSKTKATDPIGFQPLNDYVLVRPHKTPEKVGSLYLPDEAKKKQTSGNVVAVSGEVKTVAIGDEVYYGQYDGKELDINGERYAVLKSKDLIGKANQ